MHTRLLLALAAFLAPAAAQARAYAVDSNLDQLFSVDLNTGAATLIGSTANGAILGTPAGLTWRADTQTLWTIDLAGGEVGTINTATGAFTTVFTANPTAGWQGIEWDPTTNLFYLLNQNFSMYALPMTGVTTLLGASGAPLSTALEVDAMGNLLAIGFSNGIVYSVNKMTGAFTPGVTTAPVNMQGLSFDPTGRLFGANTTTDSLYLIDPMTGNTTLVGAHGAGIQFVKGFEITDCSGFFSISGVGCNDASNTPVQMTFAGGPCIGRTVNIGARVGATTPAYVLALGGSSTTWGAIMLPFSLAIFGNPGCTIYQSNDVFLGVFAANSTAPVPIPGNAGLVNRQVLFQAYVFDAALPGLGVATADLLTMTMGQ
jgi:hypothetical protein